MLYRMLHRLNGLRSPNGNGRTLLASLILVGLLSGISQAADEWGTIQGRLVYVGTPATPAKIKADKDPAVCNKHPLVDESLVVGESKGIANAFVYLRLKPGEKVAAHPDYAQAAKDSVELDNHFCRFTPHAAVLRGGQTLVLKNSDTVPHNVKGDMVKNASYNVLIPPGQSIEKTDLTKSEIIPLPVGCNIHPWMKDWLLVREDPYAVVTDKDGNFEIKNIPVGKREFQLWQEKVGYLDGVKVQGKAAAKGRFSVALKPGVLDLGDIPVDGKMFQGK